jgi:tetratricopeptide (TPR) repeat protein
MKKIILSILIILVIPVVLYVGLYVYTVYLYEPDSLTQAYIEEKDPKKKLKLLERRLNNDEYERWAWLDDAAELAYESEDYKKAKQYSLESLSLSGEYVNDWNYGNSIHNANMVLGRLSLQDGEIESAKEYLLKSAKSKGSPQLDTFGPSLILAKELLETGEKEAVIKYLHSVSTFWEMDNGCISRLINEIENNNPPVFCNCGC